MFRQVILYVCILIPFLLGSCGKAEHPLEESEVAAVQEDKKEKTASVHGKAGAIPGSHEDWCGEHQVPESLCTRCNPSLVPAFKATGDWCEEHGLPESQCLVCNPNLKIERPPQSGEGDS